MIAQQRQDAERVLAAVTELEESVRQARLLDLDMRIHVEDIEWQDGTRTLYVSASIKGYEPEQKP